MGVKVTDADFSACRCCDGACQRLLDTLLLPEQSVGRIMHLPAMVAVALCLVAAFLEAALERARGFDVVTTLGNLTSAISDAGYLPAWRSGRSRQVGAPVPSPGPRSSAWKELCGPLATVGATSSSFGK
jgi:hypothetical protein